MRSICEQPLHGIILMILHMSQSSVLIRDQNLQIFLRPNSLCCGTLALPFHFLSNMLVITERILTGPARVEWLWDNDFSPNEYHIWHAWPSTGWHLENKIWSISVHYANAQSLAEVKRQRECPGEWIAELVWLHFMAVPMIKSNI